MPLIVTVRVSFCFSLLPMLGGGWTASLKLAGVEKRRRFNLLALPIVEGLNFDVDND